MRDDPAQQREPLQARITDAKVETGGAVKYPPRLAINPHPNVRERRGPSSVVPAVTEEKFWAKTYDRRDHRCPRGHTFTFKDATIARELLAASARGDSAIWLADIV